MEKSSHINSGLRKILEIPQIYNLKRILFGGERYRKWYVSTFNLQPGAKLLDIGCGTAHILKYLPSSIEYHGLDMEEYYIKYCRNKYGENAFFHHERIGEVDHPEWLEYFDVINMHGLIHHLSDKDSSDLMQLADKFLKPGGHVFSGDSVYHPKQSSLSRWFVSKDRGQNIRDPENYLKLANSHFTVVESKIIDHYTRIPYSLFYMKLVKT